MAFIAISGEPGCRHEELARVAARRLECELVAESDLDKLIARHFGESNQVPDRAWRAAATSIVAGLGLNHRHLVICCTGAEALARDLAALFRVHVVAPERVRIGNLISGQGLHRAAAKNRLQKMMCAESGLRKRRFGQKMTLATSVDLVLNEHTMDPAGMAEVLVAAARVQGLLDAEPWTPPAAAKVQFQVRLELARYGIVPPDRVKVERKAFGHPSEEVFANLLDFYRIAWDYEPRSFPLQWDKDGKVSEAFTPDFYLPEFDLYVELTTMKQAHVTKKNRKIRLLKAIYPHVNIQIFYQKDVRELVMNYRLPEGLVR
jgi:cytidylate kinase